MTSAGVSLTQAVSSSLPWSGERSTSVGGEALSHLAETIPRDITVSFIKGWLCTSVDRKKSPIVLRPETGLWTKWHNDIYARFRMRSVLTLTPKAAP